MNRNNHKIKEFLKKSFIFVLAFILLFEITVIKNILINIILFAEKNNILFGLSIIEISLAYNFVKKYALIYLAFCFICYPVVNCYLFIKNRSTIPPSLGSNPFEESLYKYIEDDYQGKGYLISGQWGSGKTYIVRDFFNKYYKFSFKPIYRISCFGLDSRELILEEIKNQIEINDKSLLNWMQYIPVIGKPVFGIIKDSYSLNSIPKKSIFIFDDFERITSLGITKGNFDKTYNRNRFMLRQTNYSDPQKHNYNDINKEFEKIENAFSKFERNIQNENISYNLQKYNVVTGLINELIENYKIKVIIICNIDILGYDYLDKVFRGKLDCINYNKSIDDRSIENIIQSTFNNQIFPSKAVEGLMADVTKKIKIDFKNVWLSSGSYNLRQAKSVIQAFFDTCNILNSNYSLAGYLNYDYLISLFYSIYVVGELRDENNLDHLNEFLVGGNLTFFLNLYDKTNLYNALKSSDNSSQFKWVGISIAGFWILNMELPDNINKLIKCYVDYMYNDLERALLGFDGYNWDNDDFLVEHAIFIVRVESQSKPEDRNPKFAEISSRARRNIGVILEHIKSEDDSMKEKVRSLLRRIETVQGVTNNINIIDKWFAAIFNYSKVISVECKDGKYIYKKYDEYVSSIPNKH